MNARSPSDPPFARVAPWVFLVALMFLLNYLNRALFGPLLPRLEDEFSITHAASTAFLFYISLGYSISLFLSGFTSSFIRPRLMVGGSALLCGLVMILIGMADSLPVLASLFFVLGFASGQYFNGGLSTLRSMVQPSQWSKAIGIHEIGPNASFIFGPILAETVATQLGWRGMVSLMGWISIGAGLIFLLIAKGGEVPSAKIPFKDLGRFLGDKKVWLITWLMALAIAGEFAPYSVLTLHLTLDRGYSPEMSAVLLSTSRLANPAAVILGGWLTTRFGSTATLKVSMAAYAVGMFLMALPWEPALMAGLYSQPLLTAVAFPPIFTFLAESYEPKIQPMLLALIMPAASFIGVGIMPPLLGLWGDYASFNAGFVMMGLLVVSSFPMLVFMGRNIPGPEMNP